jgi:CheY-like chemotaxis protein
MTEERKIRPLGDAIDADSKALARLLQACRSSRSFEQDQQLLAKLEDLHKPRPLLVDIVTEGLDGTSTTRHEREEAVGKRTQMPSVWICS